MKQLLPIIQLNQLKELPEPPLRPDRETIAIIRTGNSGPILNSLRKHGLKPDPRVLASLIEKIKQKQQAE